MNRAVITGLGIYSCLGTTLDAVEQSLREGRSGITLDPQRKDLGFRSALTARLDTPDLKGELSRSQRTYMPEQAKYAYVATRDALRQAGLDADYIDRHDVGILYGNDSTAEAVVHSMDILREKRDTTLIGSGSIFQSMNSTVTMNLSCIFRLRGINLTISGACASGAHAIGLGALLIRQGLQECIVCGGAQEVNPTAVGSFDGIGAFSTRESDPTRASRPFDRDRDGLIPSGGAAALVLEEYDHAVARGATILCEVVGYGFSSNGGGISQPSDEGSVTAMTRALNDANLSPADIDYVNAHATSTLQGDMFEAIALDRLFGQHMPWISSTKGMTGHECWMAGASEVVYSILMMQGGFVAPNINFENPDEHSAKLRLATHRIDTQVNTVLSNSFGFGGTNSALIIKK